MNQRRQTKQLMKNKAFLNLQQLLEVLNDEFSNQGGKMWLSSKNHRKIRGQVSLHPSCGFLFLIYRLTSIWTFNLEHQQKPPSSDNVETKGIHKCVPPAAAAADADAAGAGAVVECER